MKDRGKWGCGGLCSVSLTGMKGNGGQVPCAGKSLAQDI